MSRIDSVLFHSIPSDPGGFLIAERMLAICRVGVMSVVGAYKIHAPNGGCMERASAGRGADRPGANRGYPFPDSSPLTARYCRCLCLG